MTEFVRLDCSICDKRLLYPATTASTDRLLSAVAAHVAQRHPESSATVAERTIERAIDDAELVDVDEDAEGRRWETDAG